MSEFLCSRYDNLEPYVPGEQPKDKQYIKLNANETSMLPSPNVMKMLKSNRMDKLGFYGDPDAIELRKALAERYDVDIDEIFVGNGSDAVLSVIFLAFFDDKEKIAFPDITYGFYRTFSKSFAIDAMEMPLKDDFTVDVDGYIESGRHIVLANPNAPTGYSIPVSEIERMLKSDSNRLVVIDEAYIDYDIENESCIPLIKKYKNLIVVHTMSKSRNLAGAHIGYCIADKALIEDLNEIDLCEKIKEFDALLTAFIPINKKVLDCALNLKCISVNATGYGNIDVDEATKRNIAVCNVKEYCTKEVAEHTMALMLSMLRMLKHYGKEVDEGIWNYQSASEIERISGKTLAIFGFGRIGQAVAKRAKAFDINVITVDPYIPQEIPDSLGVTLVSKEQALKTADIISNHMNQTMENKSYFSFDEFKMMEKKPYFLNIARGECVDEDALVMALDNGFIKGAALDVLREENPDLKNNILTKYENVYLTPHAAFYSKTSIKELHRISCENIIYYMTKNYEKVFGIVNKGVCDR